ncbi:prolyl oligopeptidase family serine peptidase [Sphingomonas faeni]|uniref:prolyl oligopeptidase family serine peptidase n=1 Tax=Sphingomonas faeni TaxID=185950 RepID=UPI002782B1EE|nr:prolyl oligopeptidase family serine peptidase [Sphingomonas faeni]MDQ0836843.1 prolyl oligopeptidase [Sphingomonas faeni]
MMQRRLPFLALLALSTTALAQTPAPATDPNLYLEDIHGARALDTVKRWNTRSLAALEAKPGYARYRQRALDLLQADRQIATPDQIVGDQVLNLWQDKTNVRGLWRVASLASFSSGKPVWRTLIDVDALGKAEGKSWVWKGATCRSPSYDRCMVALSNGGGDAVEEREFDIPSGKFVADGFVVPSFKTRLNWAGPDALYVATDFGTGSLTKSGYPRTVKRWQRGTPLASATIVTSAMQDDVGIDSDVYTEADRRYAVVSRNVDFFHSKRSHVADDGRLVPSPLPDDAVLNTVLDGRLIATLASDWRGIASGSVVAYGIADVLAGRAPTIERVLVPTKTQAVEQVDSSRSVLWVKMLDDVSGRLVSLTRGTDGVWTQRVAALPSSSTIHLDATAGKDDVAFAMVESFLSPPALYAVRPDAKPVAVDTLPARFDASTMQVEQRFATSKDGTKIPYFLVRKKGTTGPVPALVHAYGGFRNAQTPTYLVDQPYRSGPAGLFWVEEGNAFVLANIRGGGEYGPRWHQMPLRENRQKAYDDLHAVGDDLVRTGVSAKRKIAVSGRSNGGLLVGVAMEQRPDLYGAIVMGSPLLDMQRYSHLSAGASWIGEYGDPDKPADWAFIARYSPYQNLKRGVRYPTPFIYTSTEDDRVHPGHARKFAARLEAYGNPFFYYENPEGGHAAGADKIEDAKRAALVTVYLNTQLGTGAIR